MSHHREQTPISGGPDRKGVMRSVKEKVILTSEAAGATLGNARGGEGVLGTQANPFAEAGWEGEGADTRYLAAHTCFIDPSPHRSRERCGEGTGRVRERYGEGTGR